MDLSQSLRLLSLVFGIMTFYPFIIGFYDGFDASANPFYVKYVAVLSVVFVLETVFLVYATILFSRMIAKQLSIQWSFKNIPFLIDQGIHKFMLFMLIRLFTVGLFGKLALDGTSDNLTNMINCHLTDIRPLALVSTTGSLCRLAHIFLFSTRAGQAKATESR
ncbi:hypothetical protein EDD86DRAFT_262461 [Gorgonomyces haynaldii]|nr:hypothetical protein EDD86DRAFT_262461 [Gorgonomyces haynaldii]